MQYGGRAGRSRFNPRQGQRTFLLAPESRPALGPTQPPIQWVPEVFSPGVKRDRGVMLTTHPHLVPRLRISSSYTCVTQATPWRAAGSLYLYPSIESGRRRVSTFWRPPLRIIPTACQKDGYENLISVEEIVMTSGIHVYQL
jgi:hypothetical protein